MKSIFYSALILVLIGWSCKSQPKVIEPTSSSSAMEHTDPVGPASQVHEVVVEDFLHASRYTYLSVSENDEPFWIAVPYTEVEVGETYYYQGGVRMHNFHSEEHDRVFETLYLVGGVSKTPSPGSFSGAQQQIDMHGGKDAIIPGQIDPVEGGVPLSNLFADKEAYRNKTILVKGQCVKMNRNIMGKNWIHLQDGTKNDQDKNFDLTITTQEEVQIGSIVIMEGIISLDKDFGSGYRYDIIMEEASLREL